MKYLIFVLFFAVSSAVAVGCSSKSTDVSGQSSQMTARNAEPEDANQGASGHSHAKDKAHNHAKGAGHSDADPVKVGNYLLELEGNKEKDRTYILFHIHQGEKEISEAQVNARVQMPDGEQKSLQMPFDAQENAYIAELGKVASGSFKVAVLSELDGKKFNARFTLEL